MKTKFHALLRAVLSQDMNLFKYRVQPGASRAAKLALPLAISAIIMFSVGVYAYGLADVLAPLGLTHVMLLVAIVGLVLITFFEGVYKSGSVLFDSKDNDLLLPLPIERHQIFAVRVLKMVLYQLLFSLLFLLPTFIVYALVAHPPFRFYPLALLMLILLPLIPTSLAALISSFTRRLAVKFRLPKIVQAILLAIVALGVILFTMNGDGALATFAENASNLDSLLRKVYYPAGLFTSLLQEPHLIDLLALILVHLVPFAIVVWLGSRHYFSIISRSRQTVHSAHKTRIVVRSPLRALVRKELNRLFSSTVYMFNSLFGIILLPLLTIVLCLNSANLSLQFADTEEISALALQSFIPKLYFAALIFITSTASITSSSISIEGKAFNLTKSLPIQPAQLLRAKILTSSILITPVLLLSSIIFWCFFPTSLIDALAMVALSFILPIFIAIIGLLFNLKYPKLNAANDTEVVKQSLSATFSVFVGFGIAALAGAGLISLAFLTDFAAPIINALFIVLTLVAWRLLKSYGTRRILAIQA